MTDAPEIVRIPTNGLFGMAREARFVRTAIDFAPGYAAATGRASVTRYIAEQCDANPGEWEWIGRWLAANEWVYDGEPFMMSRVTQIEADRREQAQAKLNEADIAFGVDDFDQAERHLWEGALLDPTWSLRGYDWDRCLAEVRAAREQRYVTVVAVLRVPAGYDLAADAESGHKQLLPVDNVAFAVVEDGITGTAVDAGANPSGW